MAALLCSNANALDATELHLRLRSGLGRCALLSSQLGAVAHL